MSTIDSKFQYYVDCDLPDASYYRILDSDEEHK